MTPHRRQLLTGAAALALTGLTARAVAAMPADQRGRPAVATRRFTSEAVERTIREVRAYLGGEGARGRLGEMFEACFPNTLDTTVEIGEIDGRPDTFVITGDIEAMWLRDSSAQVWPYVPLAKDDAPLRRLLEGVIRRQTDCILIDPYANAFIKGPTGSPHAADLTEMKPELWERKWEVDSLCYPVRLAHGYWKATGDTGPFDDRWREAARATLRTFREQQRRDGPGPYRNQRVTSWSPDQVPGQGYGNPIRPNGMIASLFRPSDDAAQYLFLVPASMFAVVSLGQMAEMHRTIHGDEAFAAECEALAAEVEAGIRKDAVVRHVRAGEVFAYEVDGYGNALFMDDANVPNLLSAPYLGYLRADDPTYVATRRLILGEDNPWYHAGEFADGIGSPHTPGRRVWPIAIVMRALTSTDDAEIVRSLRQLVATDAGTGFMHEAFDVDDPTQFSRPWFAWANTLFGELVLTLYRERPELLLRV